MRLVFARHAVESMIAREVTTDEVADVVHKFENRYIGNAQHKGRPTPYRFMYQRGSLTVCTYEPPGAREIRVLTVLLRQRERWNDDDARARAR